MGNRGSPGTTTYLDCILGRGQPLFQDLDILLGLLPAELGLCLDMIKLLLCMLERSTDVGLFCGDPASQLCNKHSPVSVG